MNGDVILAGLATLDVDILGPMVASDLAYGESFDVIHYTGLLSGMFSET